MKYEIKNRFTGKVLFSLITTSLKLCVKAAVESRAYLSEAYLRGAYLRGADLSRADLSRADLREADLSRANLREADLREAYLSEAYLRGADLRGADLRGANIEFYKFPSIRLISSIPLGNLSNKLTLELMRRDAYAHPKPEKFKEWAKGGECPYQNEERFWLFNENRDLWIAGEPQIKDSDLILEICKEKGWIISGYLEKIKQGGQL